VARASAVFTQAFKLAHDSKQNLSAHTRTELYLRYSAFLASAGDIEGAENAFREVEEMSSAITPTAVSSQLVKIVDRVELLSRAALANDALAAIYSAQGQAAPALTCLGASFRLASRIADVSCRIASGAAGAAAAVPAKPVNGDPFTRPAGQGADEPPKDITLPPPPQSLYFASKHLDGLQWFAAEVSFQPACPTRADFRI